MPRVKREVLDNSGAVPVPVAGVGALGAVDVPELDDPVLDAVEELELEELEPDELELDELELDEAPVDKAELPVTDCKADCTAAVS